MLDQIIATAKRTGNRYLRTLHDRTIAKRGVAVDPLEAMWYQGDIKAAQPLRESSVLILPGQHRVFLSGVSSERALQTGWENFETMIHERSGEAPSLSPSIGSER